MWNFLRRKLGTTQPAKSGERTHAARLDKGFEDYKRSNPGATFAQFYVDKALRTINAGDAHSTLGTRLYDKRPESQGESDFREAGRAAFARYRKLLKMNPQHKLVDYGCGSLRLGIHFIEYLEAGNYMGLDVTRDFIDIGVSAAKDLVARKYPELDAISPASLAMAAAFEADFVVSNAVSYHVHPDETDDYFANLARICAKPGARLMFDAKLADEPVRFRERGWAWPLRFYVERLAPLSFVTAHKLSTIKDERAGVAPMQSAVLEFRRA